MALAKLVRRYGMKRVGTIATSDVYADDLVRKFALDVRRNGRVEITAEERFPVHTKHDVKEELANVSQNIHGDILLNCQFILPLGRH